MSAYVCSSEPLTHAHLPAMGVRVPTVTHCVSQHPSDICRRNSLTRLFFHTVPMTSPVLQHRQVNPRGRERVMLAPAAPSLLFCSDADRVALCTVMLQYLVNYLLFFCYFNSELPVFGSSRSTMQHAVKLYWLLRAVLAPVELIDVSTASGEGHLA